MIWLTYCSLALSGQLLIDARVPSALYVDSQAYVQLSQPGLAEFTVSEGEHKLIILTNGNPTERVVTFTNEPVKLLIGRTGITIGSAEVKETPSADTKQVNQVELRSTSRLPLLITIGPDRYILAAGGTKVLTISSGEHPISIRNDNGTAIFATGTLILKGSDNIVLQLSEGRVPEVTGDGVEFLSSH
jgi:hypothetical protein